MSIEVPCLYWVYLTFTVGIVIVKAMGVMLTLAVYWRES